MKQQNVLRLYILFSLCFTYAYCTAQYNMKMTLRLPVKQEWRSDYENADKDTSLQWVSYDIWGDVLNKVILGMEAGKVPAYSNAENIINITDLWDSASGRIDWTDSASGLSGMGYFEGVKLSERSRDVFDAIEVKESMTLLENGVIRKRVDRYAPLGDSSANLDRTKSVKPTTYHKPVFWIHPGPLGSNFQSIELSYKLDLSNVSNEDSAQIVGFIKHELLGGKLEAYDANGDHELLNTAQIDRKINPGFDTIPTNWNPRKKQYDFITEKKNRAINIIQFREQWMVDEFGNVAIRVKGYTLINKYVDSKGAYLGTQRILYVKNEQ